MQFTSTSHACVSGAMLAVAHPDDRSHMARDAATAPSWKAHYHRHHTQHCARLATTTNEGAATLAAAGIAAARRGVRFAGGADFYAAGYGVADATTSPFEDESGLVSLDAAMATSDKRQFGTAIVQGSAPRSAARLQVKMGGKVVKEKRLMAQIAEWEAAGQMEPDAAAALRTVLDNSKGAAGKDWQDLRGEHFVVLGASSQMGPTIQLLQLGATVHAVDVPKPALWRKLIRAARKSPGTLIFPINAESMATDKATGASSWDEHGTAAPDDVYQRLLDSDADVLMASGFADDKSLAKVAGADLLTDAPAIGAWCAAQAPGKALTVGCYVYLDGGLFTRVTLAADAVVEKVCASRAAELVTVASLNSPTECYAVPDGARKESQRRYDEQGGRAYSEQSAVHSAWYSALNVLSRGRYMEPTGEVGGKNWFPPLSATASGTFVQVQNSYVWSQGFNYAFAKQLQRWRALVAREAGHPVVALVGPSALTASVVSNPLIAAGLRGGGHFGIFPFEPETASALLTALLIYNQRAPDSVASKTAALQPLSNPLELFSRTALHGGTWRCAWKTNSYTEVCALVHAAERAQPLLYGAMALPLIVAARARL